MAQDATCHLLELPRELRDKIYDSVMNDVFLGEALVLANTFQPSLSKTCRQINAEYTDRALSRSVMLVCALDSFDAGFPTPENGQQRIPAKALRKVKHCTVSVTIMQLVRDEGEDDVVDWVLASPITSIRAQENATWTLSQAFATRLKEIVDDISLYIADAAQVTVQIDLSELAIYHEGIDDNDNFWTPLNWLQAPHTYEIEDRLAGVVYLPTLSQVESNNALPVRMDIRQFTRLWMTLADNTAEIKSNRRHLESGITSEVIKTIARPSKEIVEWRLQHTLKTQDWRDCVAESAALLSNYDSRAV